MTEGEQLLAFLRRYLSAAAPDVSLHTSLVSSGLLDSFAVIEVLFELERISGHKIPPRLMQIADFENGDAMLLALQRIRSVGA